MVRRSATEGMLDADHATLLDRTLRFSDHSAADVMTARVRMAKLAAAARAADVIDLSQRTGFSRFPVIARMPMTSSASSMSSRPSPSRPLPGRR